MTPHSESAIDGGDWGIMAWEWTSATPRMRAEMVRQHAELSGVPLIQQSIVSAAWGLSHEIG